MIEVSAPAEVRVARLMDERGLTREQAWSDVDSDAQESPSVLLDVVSLVNEGDRAQLAENVREYWAEHVAPVLDELAAGETSPESV